MQIWDWAFGNAQAGVIGEEHEQSSTTPGARLPRTLRNAARGRPAGVRPDRAGGSPRALAASTFIRQLKDLIGQAGPRPSTSTPHLGAALAIVGSADHLRSVLGSGPAAEVVSDAMRPAAVRPGTTAFRQPATALAARGSPGRWRSRGDPGSCTQEAQSAATRRAMSSEAVAVTAGRVSKQNLGYSVKTDGEFPSRGRAPVGLACLRQPLWRCRRRARRRERDGS